MKTALVTGAARGIGLATTKLFLAEGWQVAMVDRDGDELTLASEGLSNVKPICRDVSVGQDVGAIIAEVEAWAGQLDALVNNAGIVDAKERVEDFSAARLQTMFAVNVVGAILVARNAVRRMSTYLGGNGGTIVNISSAAARLASANQYVDYAASKAAIDTFTKGLAEEVATCGIRVNAVRPGVIETDIHAKGGEPNRVARIAPLVPMQRAGTADEIAQSVLWLLSDAASYVTGAHLDVSGGR